MTGMLERVARAIDPMKAQVADMLLEKGLKREDVLGVLPMDKARAAINAMRYLTPNMVEVGYSQLDDGENLSFTWEAMIDAALNEEGQG